MQDEILKELNNQNPWWVKESYQFYESQLQTREYFQNLISVLARQQIIGVTGLRRVGKTTLLRQLITRLFNKSINPKNICYFSFDEALIARNPEILEQVISTYIEQILITKVFDLNQKVYIFFDEIQYFPMWQAVLKRYYDASRFIKFIISGSASLLISGQAVESLAGRIIEIFVPPLNFHEFIKLREETISLPEVDSGRILSIINGYDPNWYLLYKENLNALFLKYLHQGGFPEIIQEKNDNFIREYISNSVISRIVRFDLVRFFDIKREDLLLALLKYAGSSTGNLMEVQNLAKSLGANRDTVTSYLSHLTKAFIIDILYNFTPSMLKQLRGSKKIFIKHPSLTYAILGLTPDNPLLINILGSLVETHVFNVLSKQYQEIRFWREKQKEVDFIVVDSGKTIPIEVKFKNQIVRKDLQHLLYFCNRFGLSDAVVITKDELGEKEIEGIKFKMIPVSLL